VTDVEELGGQGDDAERKSFRTQLREVPDEVLPPAPSTGATDGASTGPDRTAGVTVAALTVVAFCPAAVDAVLYLLGLVSVPSARPTFGPEMSSAARDVARTVAVAWLAVLACRRCAVSAADLGWRPAWGRELRYERQPYMVFCLAFLAPGLAELLVKSLGVPSNEAAPGSGPWGMVTVVTDAIGAGVLEELVLVAVLVTLLERGGYSAGVIYTVGLLGRLSFHVYYGWAAAPWVLLWGGLYLWLYRRTRRLTPLIVAHVAHDFLVGTWAQLGGGRLGETVTVSVIGLATIAIALRRLRMRRARPDSVPVTR
jgi:membrane protease YdiL (CAAX protease family)